MDNQEKDASLDRSALIVHTIKDGKSVEAKYYMNLEEWQLQNDWFRLPREEFYEKYPDCKPVFPPPRVIRDEVDRRMDYERSSGKGPVR